MQRKAPFTLLLLVAILVSTVPAALAQGPVVTPPAKPPTQGAGGGTTTTTAQVNPPKEPGAEAPVVPLAPGINAVAPYSFASSSGTYTEIAGGTVVVTSCDDTSYGTFPVGFTFTYDGVAYTTFGIQCNGFIAMGAVPGASYNPISTGATNNVISVLGQDQQTGTTNSEIRYQVLGSAPNRVLVVQYKNFRHYSGSQVYNFQIRLYETTNVVQFVYGSFTENSTYTQEVGLRGASNADFNNRMTGTWAASLPGTLNTSSMLLSSTSYPASGLTYDWNPPVAPSLGTSYKSAPSAVIIGNNIAYTVHVINNGTAPANSATMTDPIPAGTTYVAGSVSCSSGACTYNAGLNRIEWSGVVAIGGDVSISFQVTSTGLPCPTTVVNTATINDPLDPGGAVTRMASTIAASTVPALVESFDATTFPPTGWGQTPVVGTYLWIRATAGTYPTIAPHSGAGMAEWNSFSIPSGNSTLLWTPAMDLSGFVSPQVAFYMSHDTGYAGYTENVQVQVSTDGGSTWTNVGAPVYRYDASYTTPGWGHHTVDLSAYKMAGVQVGLLAYSNYGNNFFVDDVSVAEPWFPCAVATLGPSQAANACRSSDMTYHLIAGTNYLTDTYDIGTAGNSWPTLPAPTSLVLGPGDTAPVTVTVHVPWNAGLGTTDVATINSTGQTYGLSATATLATTAVDAFLANQWQNMATGSPTPLYWGASYYDSGKVCFIGGMDITGALSAVHQCYDIATATWSTRAALPAARFAPAYGWINGKFYVAGGFADSLFTGSDVLYIYDPTTDAWTTGAVLPSARGGQAGGVVNGKLYSAGGSATSSFPTDCPTYEYDPTTDTWATLAACPLQGGYGFDLGGSVGSNLNGRLYAGGHFGAYSGWYSFDPVANTWATLANLPGGVHKTPLMVENPDTGQIYMVGGLIGWAGTNGVYEYNVAGNTWDPAPPDILTAQGGSLGPAQGSFADPVTKGFWTFGGTVGSYAINPAPFEFWGYEQCPPVVPDIAVTPDALSAAQCPDTVTTQTLSICNNGLAPLNWSISELSGTGRLASAPQAPLVPAGPATNLPGSSSPAVKFQPAQPRINALSILLLDTTDTTQSVQRALNELGYSYDHISSSDWTGIDFSPYDVVLIGMDGGTVEAASLQALRTNVIDQGKRLIFLGGTCYQPFAQGVNQYLVQNDTNNYCWGVSGQPNWTVVNPSHPLAQGLPPTYNFANSSAAYYSLRATDTNMDVIAVNGDGFDQFFYKNTSFPVLQGGRPQATGDLMWFIDSVYTTYWADQNDFNLLKGIIGNALTYGGTGVDVPWLAEAPITGTTWMGECQDVTVTFDSTGLTPGDYFARLLITSDDPDTPTITVPVTLTVQEPPVAVVTAPPLQAEVCPSGTLTIDFSLCNYGECALDWTLTEVSGTGVLAATQPAAPARPTAPRPSRPVVLSSVSPEAVSVETNPPIVNASVSLILDDGSRDNDIGLGGTIEMLWVNRFTPAPDEFPFALNQVQIYFSTVGLVNVGDDIVIIVYENTSGNNDPAVGSNWLASFPTTVQALDTWNVYTLTTPVVLNGPGDVIVGVIGMETPGTSYWPASMDQTATQARSWAGWWNSSPPPDPPILPPPNWTLIDVYFPGNWMVRGYGETIAPPVNVPWLSEDPTQGSVPGSGCQTVTVTFDATGMAPGTYYASLLLESNDPNVPTITLPVTLTVDAPAYINNVATGINGLTVAFTSTVVGTPPIDYLWAFGDGGTSTDPNPVHTYADAGCYNYTLDVANGCGTDNWAGQVCVCDPVHDAGFTWMPPTPVVNETVYFTATAAGTGPITYDWAFGDTATGTGQYVNHAYAAAGTYTVVMTATGECGFQVVSYAVTVASGCVPPDGADFTWLPITPTAGANVDFSASVMTGTSPLTFDWQFSDGGTDSGQNVTHVFATPGTYAVTMTVANGCGNDTMVHTVVVAGVCEPVTNTAFTWLPPSPQVGEDVTFNATADGSPVIAFAWALGDGATGSGATAVHAYTAPGDYDVILTATNACGGQMVLHTVTVVSGCVAPAGADFTWLPLNPTTGQAVSFNGTLGAGTTPLYYTWDFGDGGGASGSLTPSYIYNNAGTFTVTLTVTNTCGTTTAVHPLTVQSVVTRYYIYLPLITKNY
jgi:uncharacterized repeat protein (TIGR01451 family)